VKFKVASNSTKECSDENGTTNLVVKYFNWMIIGVIRSMTPTLLVDKRESLSKYWSQASNL